MARYLITWDIGYGLSEQEIEADSVDEANMIAYECAKEDFETQVSYSAELIEDDDVED